MRIICSLVAAILAISSVTSADSPSEAKRDAALKGVDACIRRNEVASKECRGLNKNVEILTEVYRQGDKTILPTLLRFTYLTDFFDEALLADPDGFLSTVASLPEANQHLVAGGLSGGMFGLSRSRFDAVRATLRKLPDSSPNRELANKFLATLETCNASFLVDYFPDGTFVGPTSDFVVRSYSRELYALDEKPLWPSAPGTATTYRITVLPAFSVPESVSLSILPDGTGSIRFRSTDFQRLHLNTDNSYTLDQQHIAKFLVALGRSDFWKLPTESSERGLDGGEWILEGIQNDKYHVVVRWCPNNTPFGELAGDLFELAHHKPRGGC